MTHLEKVRKDKLPLITAAVIAAGTAASIAVLYAKAVSTLFKLNRALDIYITEHERREEEKRKERLRHDYDEEENISI